MSPSAESTDKFRLVWLSYSLSTSTPSYGGGEGLRVEQTRSLDRGDTSNNSRWSLPNHLGTHLDAPLHFWRDGVAVEQIAPEQLVFDRVQLVDAQMPEGLLIRPEHLAEPLAEDLDLLLLRTGFGKSRGTREYWEHGPGVHSEFADHLRRSAPHCRMIGFDFISLSSFQHREVGRQAHRAFLDPQRPILILEDMDLSALDDRPDLTRVTVLPLRVDGADGAPVTVLAELGKS